MIVDTVLRFFLLPYIWYLLTFDSRYMSSSHCFRSICTLQVPSKAASVDTNGFMHLQLYRVDKDSASFVQQLTWGEWMVEKVLGIDADKVEGDHTIQAHIDIRLDLPHLHPPHAPLKLVSLWSSLHPCRRVGCTSPPLQPTPWNRTYSQSRCPKRDQPRPCRKPRVLFSSLRRTQACTPL